MAANPFVVAPSDYPAPLTIVGEEIIVLASGKTTQGYEIFLQRGPEGSGPPPHSHDWDESFYVIRGEMHFGIGPETKSAVPGTLVHLPAGTEHWFRFGPGGAEMLSMTSRMAASVMFTELSNSVESINPDFQKFTAIAESHGLKMAG